MIKQLSGKYRKLTAMMMLTVFYSDLVLAAYMPVRNYAELEHHRVSAALSNGSASDKDLDIFYPDEKNTPAGKIKKADDKIDAPFIGITSSDNNATGTSSEEERLEDIGGPTQPEMQSFQSVGSDNMVDLFSGDFSYNVPLLDVGGYPVNLFYRSGITMDQEASWVGLGWNINPGTITRNMRGLPDDFNGANDSITKTISVKDNKTIGVTAGADFELLGYPADKFFKAISEAEKDSVKLSLRIGGSAGVFHNTYKGWGLELGLNASLGAGKGSKGPLSGGLSFTDNTQEGFTASPSLSVRLFSKAVDDNSGFNGSLSIGSAYNSRGGLRALNLSVDVKQYAYNLKNKSTKDDKVMRGEHLFGLSPSISFSKPSYSPTISIPYTSTQFSFTGKVGVEAWGGDPNFFINGYGSKQFIAEEDKTLKLPAYGYMNYQDGAKSSSPLLDFNRDKDIPYRETPPVPNIGVPSYTYDVFSISGEGTGGNFRAYRGDIGYIYDHPMKTKDNSDRFSIDVGLGNAFKAGTDLNVNSSFTQNGPWQNNNLLKSTVGFKNSDSVFEAVYFKNPGEKSINSTAFYNAIGGDDVVAATLSQSGSNSPVITAASSLNRYSNKEYVGTVSLSPAAAIKTKRDKRSQVITYLNAAEAQDAGLSKVIERYAVNKFGSRNCGWQSSFSGDTLHLNDTVTLEKRLSSYRKANHLSEIDVLNPDGRRYVYGIPVYNFYQKEVTFSVNHANGNKETGLVSYSSTDDSKNNAQGQDNYYTSEETPAYAHSYLLTGILSPDYVDVTGNGISPDDLGDAVKFNYSKLAGVSNPIKWRTPYATGANYNEGLQSDNRDDKGSYIYGTKELWYLNSIESKTMIATFTLEDRKDQLPVDMQGNKDTTNNNHNGPKLLREINLYSKAEFAQKGTSARPIKTVHFEYDYSLCRGVLQPKFDSGKLTLKKVWFTYNGNKKKKKNPYIFNYNSLNPSYNERSSDRWGNYKNASQNPGYTNTNHIRNDEYPYSLQDSTLAATNAAAWTLDSIVLPSGGRIKVTYESDDYAFIQDKRAMQMFKIAGFGNSSSATPVLNLYNYDHWDNLFVFVKVPAKAKSLTDLYTKYLEGVSKIYFKMLVQMPSTDEWGSGSEYVPTYADLDVSAPGGGYGFTSDSNRIWIRLKGISIKGDEDGSYSPLAKSAIQFLRLNLPSKAYPGSDVGDDVSFGDAVKMVLSMGDNIKDAINGFDMSARKNNWACAVDTSKSFVRLDNPYFTKYGGGLRVKRIKIYDNWNNMSKDNTGTGQKESVYGQEYSYKTIKEINGVKTEISSGVATYEPMLGNEENPFRQPLPYVDKVAPMAPVTLGYVEEPLCEAFFPAPSVGYSKVRVRSINATNVKSATGWDETCFYTSYDFPVITDNSMINDLTKKRYKPQIANFLKIDAKHYLALSQGFKVELNDMNGRMRSQASYPETDPDNPINYTEYFYKVDNKNAEHKHLANTVNAIGPDGTIDTTAVIGKDVELMMDMREQYSLTSGANVSLNTDVFVIGIFPIPIPTSYFLPQREEDIYRSIAATKVIQRYAIMDSVVAIDKGSRISTENMLYDSETGEVLLTRTKNEFNDTIYNFTYPAHWAYSGMGLAFNNAGAVFKNVEIANGFYNRGNYPAFNNYFESGDEILVTGKEKTGETQYFPCGVMLSECKTNVYASTYTTRKIWAVVSQKVNPSMKPDTLKDEDGNIIRISGTLAFIKEDGTAYSADSVTMKIIRSGKRNSGTSPVGSITCLKNPLKTISGKLQLAIDSTVSVLNAGTVVYKDKWIVDTFCAQPKAPLNPYRTGILGNWRGDQSIVYYGPRREEDPNAATDIRKNGVLSNFVPYWTFENRVLTSTTDTTKWVWNARTTLFNKKGMDLENTDPLGRYNAGLYGYDNTLPVAVTQNSKFREQYFDGFEDKQFDAGGCSNACPAVRGIDFTKFGGAMDTTKTHSGKYSLKINTNTNDSVPLVLKTISTDTRDALLTFKIDTTIIWKKIVDPKGNGTLIKDADDYFTGYIQVKDDGKYNITASVNPVGTCNDCGVRLILENGSYNTFSQTTSATLYDVPLLSGSLYKVRFRYENNNGTAEATKWATLLKLNQTCKKGVESYLGSDLVLYDHTSQSANGDLLYEYKSPFYTPDSSGSLRKEIDKYCTKLVDIHDSTSQVNPSFALTPGTKYVFSTWVKEDKDCLCESYTGNQVCFRFGMGNNNPDSIITAKPAGNIIEGWQRYEQVFTVPAAASGMSMILKSTGSSAVYFDDIRIHPYNAAMQSFVYNPLNLRLMAQLDENNYATYYEYDDEGTLIRLKKETERGVVTIKETRSSLGNN